MDEWSGQSQSVHSTGKKRKQLCNGGSRNERRPLQNIDNDSDSQQGFQNSQSLSLVLFDPAANVTKPKGLTHTSRLNWSDCKENLDMCHRGFLIDRLQLLQAKLQDSQQALRKTKRQLAARDKECNKLWKKLTEAKSADDETLQVEKHLVKLTVAGTIALGVRKSLALTSAIGFPIASLLDVSRQTVVRSEVNVWSAVCARSRAFHNLVFTRLESVASLFEDLQTIANSQGDDDHDVVCLKDSAQFQSFASSTCVNQVASEKDYIERDLGFAPTYQLSWMFCRANHDQNTRLSTMFCLGGTFLSGDATNSSIWRQSKLQGLMVQSSLLTNVSALEHETEYANAFSMRATMCPGENGKPDYQSFSTIQNSYRHTSPWADLFHSLQLRIQQ